MKKATKLRLIGGLVLLFNLWLIGQFNLEGVPVLLLTFGFAAGYEFLVVRTASRGDQGPAPVTTLAQVSTAQAPIDIPQQEPWGNQAVSSAIHEQILAPKEASRSEEDSWALALTELEGDARRPGLWARCFAQSNGDDSRAKAMYLRERAAEFINQAHSDEAPRADAPASAIAIRNSEHRAQHALRTDISSPEKCAATLVTLGCRVTHPSEGVWEVLHPSGVTSYARSPEDLQKVASRYAST